MQQKLQLKSKSFDGKKNWAVGK